MTQNERVLQHMENKGAITSLEAFLDYGITRLSARIYDLRKDGHIIVGKKEKVMNRYGEKVCVNSYRLVK